ncbi:hypothetical protein BVZ31_17425 [Alcaligenes faecalis]|nr:hypothetical protein BVZ30_07085 [Alcaligenes faecalis]OSZ47862.1 hypothetical protein BVZ31_17425 [Alcaligenes faecalis]OSZ48893.1 hypothetical protein BVZ32_18895 [Alcaligenes faecalis]
MNTRNLRLDQGEHAAQALLRINQFTWLHATELGRLLHPGQQHSRKYAEAHLRKLSQLRLVIARQLPGAGAGRAYVLSSRGASQLNDWNGGPGYSTGKDWGSTKDGVWLPPASWRHDLIATGVLSLLAERNLDVYPESYLRRIKPDASKHPDGLIANREKGFSMWLEVENARKSGRNIDKLVEALAKASRANPITTFDIVQDAPVKLGLVAIDADARDERGFRLNHLHRIESTLRKTGLVKPLPLAITWVTMKGVGVGSIRIEQKVYEATV